MSRLRFPSSLDGLTPEIVTALLAEQHPDAVVADVEVIRSANRGDEVASTADRVLLDLEYEEDVGLPRRMLLKTVLLHRGLRFGPSAIRMTGEVLRALGSLQFGSRLRPWVFSAIGAYQRRYPQAPDAMYINEVRFYRTIRSELSIEAPQCFGSVFDETHRTFGVLMEDLTLRDVRFPNALTSVTIDEIRGMVAIQAGGDLGLGHRLAHHPNRELRRGHHGSEHLAASGGGSRPGNARGAGLRQRGAKSPPKM